MEPTWKFQRGDVYFVRLELGIGSEQNGVRPVVILQNDVGNACSPTLIVAALTSKIEKKAMQPTHSLVELDSLNRPLSRQSRFSPSTRAVSSSIWGISPQRKCTGSMMPYGSVLR